MEKITITLLDDLTTYSDISDTWIVEMSEDIWKKINVGDLSVYEDECLKNENTKKYNIQDLLNFWKKNHE